MKTEERLSRAELKAEMENELQDWIIGNITRKRHIVLPLEFDRIQELAAIQLVAWNGEKHKALDSPLLALSKFSFSKDESYLWFLANIAKRGMNKPIQINEDGLRKLFAETFRRFWERLNKNE